MGGRREGGVLRLGELLDALISVYLPVLFCEMAYISRLEGSIRTRHGPVHHGRITARILGKPAGVVRKTDEFTGFCLLDAGLIRTATAVFFHIYKSRAGLTAIFRGTYQ